MENQQYLSNEQIEKVEWELISVDIRFTDNVSGEIDLRFAYKPDDTDRFKIKDGKVILTKVLPNNIVRDISKLIKEAAPTGSKKVIKRVKREKKEFKPYTVKRI